MQQPDLDQKIALFWEWFLENEDQYKEVTDPRSAKEAMDNQILDFGLFAWEIGPGNNKPFYLTLSPNGDGDRLLLSQRIMDAAPDLQDWEFNYCKPPRDWDFTIELYDMFLEKRSFDVSDWEYVLIEHPDDYIELIIRANNLGPLDPDDRLDAGERVITNILGEELVIHHLYALEMVTEFKPEHLPLRHNIRELKRHFEQAVPIS